MSPKVLLSATIGKAVRAGRRVAAPRLPDGRPAGRAESGRIGPNRGDDRDRAGRYFALIALHALRCLRPFASALLGAARLGAARPACSDAGHFVVWPGRAAWPGAAAATVLCCSLR